MTEPRLNLIVLRSRDLEAAERFYRTLGLRFVRHRHGDGPEHLCAEGSGLVFEVYPSSDDSPSTAGARLGFEVADLELTLRQLVGAGGRLVRRASQSPWGLRAIVDDPDGHRLELTRPAG